MDIHKAADWYIWIFDCELFQHNWYSKVVYIVVFFFKLDRLTECTLYAALSFMAIARIYYYTQ